MMPNIWKPKYMLAHGDKVILYTDGIVEAMNPQNEIFGFERLLEIAKEMAFLSADALLKEILDRVNSFVGSAPQHDDLTVIILSVESGAHSTDIENNGG